MYIKKILIENFRGIRKMELELHPKLNVFIGTNGAGKSSVLDAVGYLFAPIVKLWDTEKQYPLQHSDDDFPAFEISVGETRSELSCILSSNNLKDFPLILQAHGKNEQPKQQQQQKTNNLVGTQSVFDRETSLMKHLYGGDVTDNFAVLIYYRANRVVKEVPLKAWMNRNFKKTDAYIDALTETKFLEFFEWFRNREDLENETKADDRNSNNDLEVQSVRNAINAFLGNSMHEVRVRRRNPLRMVVMKNGKELRIEQLSDGEKCLLALVGDIARRLAIANPERENPLEGEGIVLIDEIDLHLHPQWQRMILPKLTEIFPNCQFIVSTHSPQILGEIRSENIICLQDGENGIEYRVPSYEIYGQTSDVLLEDIMKTPERDFSIKEKISAVSAALEQGELENAKQYLNELRRQAVDIPELVRLDLRLSRKEIVGK
ncbi:MAG: AAA family ATPase [Planctomycetaceae bacterium]|jgi:predicted ATP-binding protein involved in virulence|nr:AAA family ATPase [Planctomycetaceae bacterium]